MALEDNANSMVMPVAPMYGGYGNGGGMFGGDSWAWIILLLLLAGNGWGNGYGGGNAGGLYPWINQTETVNNGFRDQALMGGINGIQTGVQGLSTQMCNGFSGVNTNMLQGLNDVSAQIANYGFQNALATANLQNVVQTENCADRTALSDGVRDIITIIDNKFNELHNTMYQDKLDAKDTEIANLRTQLNMLNLATSQGAQTAQLIADNSAQTDKLIQRIAPYPIPSWTVPNPYVYTTSGYGCPCNA